MEVIAKGKFIRVSPKKAREIADLIRGKNAQESRNILKFMPLKAAKIVDQVLASAMANAENNFNLDKKELTITKIMIDGGPVLKRIQPRAKGMAYQIKKRTSHISVIVSGDVKTKKPATEKETTATKTTKTETENKETRQEIERPQAKVAERGSSPVLKNKVFRRKTG